MRAAFAAVIVGLLAGACEQLPDGFDFSDSNTDSRAEQLVRVAETTRAGGDLVNAITMYQRASDLRPDWPDPLIGIGETAYVLGDYTTARDAYARAADAGEGDESTTADASVGLGRSLLRLGAFDEALAAFDAAPDDPRALNGGAIALDLMDRPADAQARYETAVAQFPDSVALRTNHGLSLALSGDHVAAIEVLSEALRLDDAGARTRQNLALVHGLSGDDDAARELLTVDLAADAVANNLAVYETLRAMSDAERTRTVFGFGGLGAAQ